MPKQIQKGRVGLSPRAYQALLDRCRLWDLVSMQTPQVEIAQIMGKDAAWVSRTVKEIQADFSTVHATPNESGIIQENVVRWETLYAEARRVAVTSDGFKRVSALRLCAELLRHKAEYEVTVGWVANRRYADAEPGKPTMEELRDEISDKDLEHVVITLGEHFKAKKMKAVQAKEIPALPQPAETAN